MKYHSAHIFSFWFYRHCTIDMLLVALECFYLLPSRGSNSPCKESERQTDSPDFGWREGETVLQDERGREEGGIRWSGRLIRKTEILLRETRPPHTRLSNPWATRRPWGLVVELVSELIGSLKLGNVGFLFSWFIDQRWPKSVVKNPNIAALETSYQLLLVYPAVPKNLWERLIPRRWHSHY